MSADDDWARHDDDRDRPKKARREAFGVAPGVLRRGQFGRADVLAAELPSRISGRRVRRRGELGEDSRVRACRSRESKHTRTVQLDRQSLTDGKTYDRPAVRLGDGEAAAAIVLSVMMPAVMVMWDCRRRRR